MCCIFAKKSPKVGVLWSLMSLLGRYVFSQIKFIEDIPPKLTKNHLHEKVFSNDSSKTIMKL
jgi:hypothetical protein